MILDPVPGYVIKTVDVTNGTKVFINVCSDHQIECPSTLDASEIAMQISNNGDWVVPIVVSNGREDKDKSGKSCIVFDCCMNPHVLLLGVKEENVKILTDETCIELVEDRSGMVLSRDYKFPKMKKKGELEKTVFNADMPHERNTADLNAGLVDNDPKPEISLTNNETHGKPPVIEVLNDENGENEVNFYFHVYKGPYMGSYTGEGRPTHVVEISGLQEDIMIIDDQIAVYGKNSLNLNFKPRKHDSFYNQQDETTYVMLWK